MTKDGLANQMWMLEWPRPFPSGAKEIWALGELGILEPNSIDPIQRTSGEQAGHWASPREGDNWLIFLGGRKNR